MVIGATYRIEWEVKKKPKRNINQRGGGTGNVSNYLKKMKDKNWKIEIKYNIINENKQITNKNRTKERRTELNRTTVSLN